MSHKLLLIGNFSYPHVGGSEVVLQQISEKLANNYNYEVVVASSNATSGHVHNNVKYENTKKFNPQTLAIVREERDAFVGFLNSFDSVFVYSDSCYHWYSVLQVLEEIKAKVYIVPLGMYSMRSSKNRQMLQKFIQNCLSGKLGVINHSDIYEDAVFCKKSGINYPVIPNGVDLNSFTPSLPVEEFRKKYNVKNNKIISCVANFFPGKGQEHLFQSLKTLQTLRKDFTALFICSHTEINVINKLMETYSLMLKRASFDGQVLMDLPRKDVINSFFASDVMVLPSQKEVAPLVLLESMAARCPWISFDVGNALELTGGIVITKHVRKSETNSCIINQFAHVEMARCINNLLNDQGRSRELGEIGRKTIEEKYNWNKIAELYHQEFSK